MITETDMCIAAEEDVLDLLSRDAVTFQHASVLLRHRIEKGEYRRIHVAKAFGSLVINGKARTIDGGFLNGLVALA